MPIHHWVILIVTLAALTAGILWVSIIGRLLWRWPPGTRVTVHRDSDSLVYVVAETKPTKQLQHVCDMVLSATMIGWRNAGLPSGAWEELAQVTVWFRPRKDFPQGKENVAAYRTDLRRYVGSETMPMFVIREELRTQVIKTGEPLIHETLHQLCRLLPNYRPNSLHEEPGVWIQSSGEDSAQRLAQHSYQAIRRAAGIP